MTLDEYLKTFRHPDGKEGLSDTAFAERAGLSQSQVTRLRSGKSKPSFEAIEAVRAASDGAVTPNDWFQAADAIPERAA